LMPKKSLNSSLLRGALRFESELSPQFAIMVVSIFPEET